MVSSSFTSYSPCIKLFYIQITIKLSKFQNMENSNHSASREDKKNLSHFANIVRIAKSDQEVSTEEMELLFKIAKKYKISDEQIKNILADPDSIPTLELLELEERIERLYELMLMIEADREMTWDEIDTLKKIVTGLSFPFNQIDKIVKETLKTDIYVTDLNNFKRDIYKLLRIK